MAKILPIQLPVLIWKNISVKGREVFVLNAAPPETQTDPPPPHLKLDGHYSSGHSPGLKGVERWGGGGVVNLAEGWGV